MAAVDQVRILVRYIGIRCIATVAAAVVAVVVGGGGRDIGRIGVGRNEAGRSGRRQWRR